MSDAPDPDSKTEEPTEKKIHDALEKGTASIAGNGALLSIGCITIIIYLFLYNSAAVLKDFLSFFIDSPGSISIADGRDAASLLQLVAISVGTFLLPIVCILMVGGILASVLQNAPRIASTVSSPNGRVSR